MPNLIELLASLRGRWWAEGLLRSAGLALLAGSARAGDRLVRLVHSGASSQGTAAEFVLAAAAFALLCLGLAMLLEGPGLFRQVPIPPRSAWIGAKAPRHR